MVGFSKWLAMASLLAAAGKVSAGGIQAIDAAAELGRYLTDAGNCVTCHTQPGAAPFTGGVAFETPFGTLYSSNITPDRLTGIGGWRIEDFRRAMHEGIGAGGRRLFPAFPYTAFTKISNDDVDAIYHYLRTVKPRRYSPPDNDLLLRIRWPLVAWNALYFNAGRFQPDASKSNEWNRGAYLVEGLGHCSACHTPRNALMAEVATQAYDGGALQAEVATGVKRRWSAVNLTASKQGLASWSAGELARYLHNGMSLRAGTFGPMNEVIVNSLSRMSVGDVRAMAAYLKSLPARKEVGAIVAPEQVQEGAVIYKDRCEKCHSASGRGGMFSGPPVAGSAVVQTDDPASLINLLVYGPGKSAAVSFGAWETMPAYGNLLDDDQIAALSNFLRGSWGNRAPPVTKSEVAQQR